MSAKHGATGARRAITVAGHRGILLVLPCLLLIASGAAAQDELEVELSPTKAYASPRSDVVFTATVTGPAGDPVAADVEWFVIPSHIGTMGEGGRFTAAATTGRGIVRAVASHGGRTGTGYAVVAVGSEPPLKLEVGVSPRIGVVGPGAAQRFVAAVTDAATGAEIEADLRWIVIPEALGSVDPSGMFTAGSEAGSGRIAVRARSGGREGVGDAAIVVGTPPGPGVRLSVVPTQALLAPGEEIVFGAVVTDASGDPVDAGVEWAVMPARLGAIDDRGLFTSGPDEGVGRAVATVATREGPVRGFADVAIRSPGPAGVQVRVRPREAAIVLGGDVRFDAIVTGPDGRPLDVPVEWSVRPAWIGEIGPEGLFVAADEMPEPAADGRWLGTIVASVETHAGTASDAARLVVRDSAPGARLRIQPRRPIVTPWQDVQFEARVIDAGDPITWTTEWTVFPRDLGTITPDGLFTPNSAFGEPGSGDFGPHEGLVWARATLDDGSTISDRALVRVRIPGQPVRVKVVPALAAVEPGGSIAFEAIVVGPEGEELDLPVEWHVRPRNLGTISDDGVFTAANAQAGPDTDDRPRESIIAEVRLGSGQVYRGFAVVVIETHGP